MNKLSIIIILLSCALSIFSHLINQIDALFFSLPMFYPSVDLFIRFEDLMIIFGFVGIFLSTTQYKLMKLYSLLFSIFGMIRFFFIEFNLIERYGLVSNLLMLIYMVMLILWVLEIKKIQVVALINRSHAFVMMLVIYFVAVQITSLLSYNALNSTLSATQMILPFFMIVYYAGFWIFFSEWYREAFIYKNPTLLDI